MNGNATPRGNEDDQNAQEKSNVINQQTTNVTPDDYIHPNGRNTNEMMGRMNQQQRQHAYDNLRRIRQNFTKNEAYQKLLPYLSDIFLGNQYASRILSEKRMYTKLYNMNRYGFRNQFDCLKDVYQSCPDVSHEYLLDVLNCSHNRHDYVFISSRASESHEWQVFEMELIDTLRMIIKDDMAKR